MSLDRCGVWFWEIFVALGSVGILLVLIVFFTPLRLRFSFTWEEGDDQLQGEIEVTLALGLVRRSQYLRFKPPEPLLALFLPGPATEGRSDVPHSSHDKEDPQKKARTSVEGVVQAGTSHFSPAEFAERLKVFLRARGKFASSYAQFKRSLRHGRIEELWIQLVVGTEDATTSAYLVSFLWGFLGFFLGRVSSFVPFRRLPKLHISPVFAKPVFSGRVEGIVRISVVHAIRAALIFYQMYRKGRDEG